MTQTSPQFRIAFCTTGSMDEASNIAEHLVGNHVAACVNIIPSIRSVFWWNNKVYQDNEVLMMIKTEVGKIPEVEKAIRLLHSYEIPELITLPIEYGMPEYMKWMEAAITLNDDK